MHPAGSEAITLATLLAMDEAGLHWRLQPLTGRAHQLRVELARRGCPIHGDALYGSQHPYGNGIALRAIALDFTTSAAAQALGLPEIIEVEAGELAVGESVGSRLLRTGFPL